MNKFFKELFSVLAYIVAGAVVGAVFAGFTIFAIEMIAAFTN